MGASSHIHWIAMGALLLAGCATNIPPVTPQMAAAAGQPASTLEHGRQLYGGPCSACHSPYSPADYSVTQWRKIIPDMGERAKPSLTDHEAVLAYVLAARTTPPTTQR